MDYHRLLHRRRYGILILLSLICAVVWHLSRAGQAVVDWPKDAVLMTVEPVTSKLTRLQTTDAAVDDEHPIMDAHKDTAQNETTGPKSYNCREPVIILGVKKSGTGAFTFFLRIHGNIVQLHDIHIRTVMARSYARQPLPCKNGKQIIELVKYPNMLFRTTFIKEIHKWEPDIKLFIVLREPVARAVSDYLHEVEKQVTVGSQNIPSFEDMVITTNGEINTEQEIVTRSLYSKYIEMWLKYFNRSQIHVVNGHKLVSEPVHELQLAEEFLDLPKKINNNTLVYDIDKQFYCRKNAKNELHCLPHDKGRTHPIINATVMQKLTSFYETYNEQLFKMIGKRLW